MKETNTKSYIAILGEEVIDNSGPDYLSLQQKWTVELTQEQFEFLMENKWVRYSFEMGINPPLMYSIDIPLEKICQIEITEQRVLQFYSLSEKRRNHRYTKIFDCDDN